MSSYNKILNYGYNIKNKKVRFLYFKLLTLNFSNITTTNEYLYRIL